MYVIEPSYGKQTFDIWNATQPSNLANTKTNYEAADAAVWSVCSFRELIESVAFVGAMNKRTALFYRGQTHSHDPIPTIFRDKWTCFGSDNTFDITPRNRGRYWEKLPEIGQRVYEICKSKGFGLPRWRGLRDIREVQWTVIQHYGLWPTPLIDLSGSLRVAAAFAMNCEAGNKDSPREGYVYVVGMPHATGSITFDIDHHIVLASLSSACPPVAKRPHYQEGYLAGHFPLYNVDEYVDKEHTELLKTKCRLVRRLIAKFKLIDDGKFWDADFPLFTSNALYPRNDPLRDRFLVEFGPASKLSSDSLAEEIREMSTADA